MFRIEIFVDDRKLSYVLLQLSGHVIEMKAPQPVANAQLRNGRVAAKTSGNRVEMLMKHLAEKKITEMTGPDVVRDFCVGIGLSDKSYSNVLNNALKARLLKRRPQKGKKGNFIYSVAKVEA
jgi:hypothetical protein